MDSAPDTLGGGPSDRTLNLGRGGAWRCVSLGSVYVAARVGAVCLLACVIACGLCEVPGGAQLRLALVCGWSAVSRREQTEHHNTIPFIHRLDLRRIRRQRILVEGYN